MARKVKVVIDNYDLSALFKDDFIRKLKSIDEELAPVAVVSSVSKEESEPNQLPITLLYEDREAARNKNLSVESKNTAYLEAIEEYLENQ